MYPPLGGPLIELYLVTNTKNRFSVLLVYLLPNDSLFKDIYNFITTGDRECVAAVERLPFLHYSVDMFSCPLVSRIQLWN